MELETENNKIEQPEERSSTDAIDAVDTSNVEKSAVKICPRCKANNAENAIFCNKCGWDFTTDHSGKSRCPKCGAEYDTGDKFCLKCGYKLEKNIGKRITIIVGIVLVLALVGGATGYYMHKKAVYEAEQEALREAEQQRQEQILAYQTKAIELYDDIRKGAEHFNMLSMMYTMAINQGNSNTLMGTSFFVSYVEGLCSSEISTSESRNREIESVFAELNALECSEPEVDNLKKAIENYYYAYSERYELLVDGEFTASNFESKDTSSDVNYSAALKAASTEVSAIRNTASKKDDGGEEDTENN